MFRKLGKSKIAFILAILFGISLFFIKGGSRYSNILNSDNVVANVSGTKISTTKFNRTLQMNINNFSQLLGKTLTGDEIRDMQIHSLALSALINDAIFENEFDKKNFKLDEVVIAKKTKERIPQLYNANNKINNDVLNRFLQEQQLKIEDIVQIIDYETRNDFFEQAFFKVDYPQSFSQIISDFDRHKRKIEYIKLSLNEIAKENNIEINEVDLKDFYNNNIQNYMTEEKRGVEYVIINKDDFKENFNPSDFEISEYYENNKNLYFEKEKRNFIQFNFKKYEEAQKFKDEIKNINNPEKIIQYANQYKIKFNTFKDMLYEDMFDETSEILFKLGIGEQSEIIDTSLGYNIIVLEKIIKEKQKTYNEVKGLIKKNIKEIQVNNFYNNLESEINAKIIKGISIEEIISDYKNLEINKVNNLTKIYSDYDKKDEFLYRSLITNAFSSNKDFISNTVKLNENVFYFFNVINITESIPKNYENIKESLINDFKISTIIKNLKQDTQLNNEKMNFIKDMGKKYNQVILYDEVDKNSTLLKSNIINSIFLEKKGSNIFVTDNENVYFININDVIIKDKFDVNTTISLLDSLKNAFGNELFNNLNISTNDNLINAVLDRY